MTTAMEAGQDIGTRALDQLAHDLKQDQISSVFDLTEFVGGQISEYVSELVYTHDIVSLWESLGCPEWDSPQLTIIATITTAIEETLKDHDMIVSDITLSINTWAIDHITKKGLYTDDLDLGDVQELVRALA